jgi:hypothetical protein
MTVKKYRPYFTLEELKHLEQCLMALPSMQKAPLTKYLHHYISDIDAGFRASNHTLKPSINEKLGFANDALEEHDFAAMESLINKQLERKTDL